VDEAAEPVPALDVARACSLSWLAGLGRSDLACLDDGSRSAF